MKLIFEKDMVPEVLDAWNYYKELDKGLTNVLGAPDEPECHTFVLDFERELTSVVQVGMQFLRGVVNAYGAGNIYDVTVYAFLYETEHELRGSLKGYCIWFAAGSTSKEIITAIRNSCQKAQSDSFSEFMQRAAKLRMSAVETVIQSNGLI